MEKCYMTIPRFQKVLISYTGWLHALMSSHKSLCF